MAKTGDIQETKIDRFDGGIVNDPRSKVENTCRVVSNFDTKNNWKLSPYRSSEDGDAGSSTKRIQNWQVAYKDSTDGHMFFGLGLKSGSGTVAGVYRKNIGTGLSSSDFDDSGWASPTNGESASGATNFELFIYYRRVGRIFGAKAGTTIWAFDPADVAAFDDAARSITYTNIAQGLVFSKDDVLYIPYDNKIATNDNGNWTDVAITFPSHLYITSLSEYGDFIAVSCAPLSGVGESTVFIWDRRTTTTTLTESINWGNGILKTVEEVDGFLIGISVLSGNAYPQNSGDVIGTEKVIFKYYSDAPGSTLPSKGAIKFEELVNKSTTRSISMGGSTALQTGATAQAWKQKFDNRLYFMLRIGLGQGGADRQGVWSVGRNESGQFTVVHERTTENDVALGGGSLLAFYLVGNYMFISYRNDATTFKMSKTDDTLLYSHNSIYESTKKNLGDSSLRKDLLGVNITTEPLPAAGSVTLGYKVDAQTSFTTILTHSTDDAISADTTASLPKDYKEIEFQLVSTGGAEITSFSFKERITGKRSYT